MNWKVGIYMGLATIYCCQSPNGEDKPLQIIPERYENQIDFSHYIKDLTFIPLSVEKNLPLNSIQKFQLDKDYFFVRSFGSTSIHMFDKKGTWLKIIDGRDDDINPEGFSYDLVDFTLDKANRILYISDPLKKKIFSYDYGQDIYALTVDKVHARDIHFQNGCLYFTTVDEMKIFEVYCEGSTVTNIKDQRPSVNTFRGGYPIRTFGDTVVMSLSFYDTVYVAIGSDIQKFAVLGNPETSCKNIDRSAYFDQFVNGSGNKEKIQNMILPTGTFSILGDLWIYNLLAGQYLFWKSEINKSYLIYKNLISPSTFIFGNNPNNIFVLDEDHEGFYYMSTLLSDQFYQEAEKILNTKPELAITLSLKKFIEEFPQNRDFQNPVITRFRISDNLFAEIFK